MKSSVISHGIQPQFVGEIHKGFARTVSVVSSSSNVDPQKHRGGIGRCVPGASVWEALITSPRCSHQMLSPHPSGVVWGKLRARLLSTSAKYKLISTSVRDAETLGRKIGGLRSIRTLQKSEKKAA